MTEPTPRQVSDRPGVDPDAFDAALRAEYPARYGEAPSIHTQAILHAQFGVETDHGKWAHNNNVGNLRGVNPRTGAFVWLGGAREGAHSDVIPADQKFRAYDSLEEGMRDWFDLLDLRYPKALAAARIGDLRGFSVALKERGYYQANEAWESPEHPGYTAGLSAHANQWLARHGQPPLAVAPSPMPVPTSTTPAHPPPSHPSPTTPPAPADGVLLGGGLVAALYLLAKKLRWF